MILTLIRVWKAGFPLRKCCSSPFSINSGKGDLKNMSQTHYFHCKHSELFPSTAVAFGWICPRPFSEEGFSREELCFDFSSIANCCPYKGVDVYEKCVSSVELVSFFSELVLLKNPSVYVTWTFIQSVCIYAPIPQIMGIHDFIQMSLIHF